MDQEELDRQMSPSLWSHRFDAEEVIDAHCRVLRQETKKSAEMWETELVQYGADATEVMTVYSNDAFKEHNGSAPTVVYIHGGMWQFLSMADSGFAAGPLLEAGCKLVAVEYTIAPAGTMTQMVAQCAKAVAHTVTHVTTGPIYLVGHSAGGHLVAAMLYINWSELGLDDTAQDRIKGILSVSGLFDLKQVQACYANEALQLTDAETDKYSPLLTKDSLTLKCPVTLAIAQHEPDEFRNSSVRLLPILRNSVPTTLLDVAAVDHFDLIEELRSPTHVLTRHLFHMMNISK
eukprot:m.43988 g.43988  ORF g.43988 m.43988 type:complete len:290 (+) comp10811_c1_seq2:230-1099(+)